MKKNSYFFIICLIILSMLVTGCGKKEENKHSHNYIEGKCECGEIDENYQPPHRHNYIEGKCECGESDPNYQAPHEHNFVDGSCSCGEFEVITYEVIFVDFDGTIIEKCIVNKNESATAPKNPSREGYDFTGWSTSYNNVTSDLIVIAQYTPKEVYKNPYEQDVKNGFKGDKLEWIMSEDTLSKTCRFAIENGIISVYDKEEDEWFDLATLSEIVGSNNVTFRLNYQYLQYRDNNNSNWKTLFDVLDLINEEYYSVRINKNKIEFKYRRIDFWHTFIDLNTLNDSLPDPNTGIKKYEFKTLTDNVNLYEITFFNDNTVKTVINENEMLEKYSEYCENLENDIDYLEWLINYLSGNSSKQSFKTKFLYEDELMCEYTNLEYMALLNNPGDLKIDDYDFAGWMFYDVEWNFAEYVIIDDINLIGKVGYLKNITYNTQYGAMPNGTKYQYCIGDEYVLPAPIIEGEDVEFLYWLDATTREVIEKIDASFTDDVEVIAIFVNHNEDLSVFDPNNHIEIEFWHSMGYANQVVIEQMIDSFNEKYPNITVYAYSKGGYNDLRDSIYYGIVSGYTPTIAQTYPDHVSLYLSTNAVKQLDDYIYNTNPLIGLSENDLNQIFPSFLEEGRSYPSYGTYSLPFNKSSEALFYNKDFFCKYYSVLSKYGVKATSIDNYGNVLDVEWPNPSWEQVEAISQFYLTTPECKYGYENTGFAADDGANLFITLNQQWGGSNAYSGKDENNVLTYLFHKSTEGKKGIQWFVDGFKKGYFATATKFAVDYSSGAFKNQQVIMTLGSSAGAHYNEPSDGSFKAGVTHYPQRASAIESGQEKYVIQQGTNISLFKSDSTAEEMAGWLFMKHLMSYEMSLLWATNTAYFPIRKDVYEGNEYQAYLNGWKIDGNGNYQYDDNGNHIIDRIVGLKEETQKIYYEQIDYSYANDSYIGSAYVRDEVRNIMDAILYGDYTLEEAYEMALNNIKNKLE